MSATEQAANNAPVIEIDGLNKWYGAFHVLRDINLSVDQIVFQEDCQRLFT